MSLMICLDQALRKHPFAIFSRYSNLLWFFLISYGYFILWLKQLKSNKVYNPCIDLLYGIWSAKGRQHNEMCRWIKWLMGPQDAWGPVDQRSSLAHKALETHCRASDWTLVADLASYKWFTIANFCKRVTNDQTLDYDNVSNSDCPLAARIKLVTSEGWCCICLEGQFFRQDLFLQDSRLWNILKKKKFKKPITTLFTTISFLLILIHWQRW